jgi:hypothetical protein
MTISNTKIVLLSASSFVSVRLTLGADNAKLTVLFSVTESERGSLWRTDVNFPDWAWTITDDYDSLYTLQQELVRIANLDGFDLEFVLLVGPDNFSHCKQLQRYDRYCDKILVSTAARTPTDYSPLTGPSKISNCTIWRPITALKRKTHATTESLSWLYPDEEAPLPTSQNLTTQIWECHAHSDVDLTARYLYTPPTLPDHSAIELVSATQIHAAIKTTTKAESTAYIEKYALDPTYLKQQLARRDNGTCKVQQEILEAEKALKHLTFEDIVAGKVRDCDSDDEGECWHEANQRRQAEYRREDQVTAAYASFPFCLQSNIMGKRHRNIDRRSTKENLPSTDEDEEDEDDNDQQPDEGDLSFEETMYLRVPTRKDRIPVHKPEYGNANAWPPS